MSKTGSITGTVLVLIVVCVLGGGAYYFVNVVVPQRKAEQEREAMAAQWEELRKAIVIAGTPLVDSPQLKTMDYNAEAARLLALRSNSSLQFENVELSKAWAQIEADTTDGLLILRRIGDIDSTKPSGYEIIAHAMGNDDQENQRALNTLGQRLLNEVDKSQLEDQFRTLEAKLNGSISELQNVANGLSRNELPSAISAQYSPSWLGTYPSDRVQITNSSGGRLQNAIVFVTVRMKDGSSRVHAHYVDQWQNGSSLGAVYAYRATDYANSQSGPAPDSVDVVAYTPSGTAKTSYLLTSNEMDNLVKSYCTNLKFTGNLLGPYDEAQTNKHFNTGYQFQFEGVPTLPVTSVEVRFTSEADATTRDEIWTYPSPDNRLLAGETYDFRSPKLDGDGPTHIDLVLRFAGTNYAHELRAY